MKEFQTMADAVAEAAKICDEWVTVQGKQVVSWDDALLRADELDETYRAAGVNPFTYLCSEEGAVGITEDKEYLAQWILLPLPALPEDLEARIRADYEKSRNTQQENAQPVSAEPARHFCRFCGKEIEADLVFCRYCGAKLK
ncbi:MAG: zinc ribbon domain-containing protein [Lachnospiraceae bacterium]|nr:zinc ribbon domain-containing protein [Lachnospiraceae bacterium]